MSQNYSCRICGRFFESDVVSEYCPQCKTRDNETYLRVREYLFQKPRASIFDVMSDLKVSMSVLKRYLREDRLEIVEAENNLLKCVSCGKSIRSGYYCNPCKTSRKEKSGTDTNDSETNDSYSPEKNKNKGIKYL